MTSDNHVTGLVSDAMTEAGCAALRDPMTPCWCPKRPLAERTVKAIYLAMKSKEQASVHYPDEVERVARAMVAVYYANSGEDGCDEVAPVDLEAARAAIAALQHPAKEKGE